MSQNRSNAVTRAMTRFPSPLPSPHRGTGSFPSRRDVLRGLAGAGLGLGVARLPDLVEARKKRRRKKHKKRKPQAKPNEFGCLEVNDPCTSADQCCSGICEGKKCRAHGAGTCEPELQGVCLVGTPDVLVRHICNNSPICRCYRTTAGSNFCADLINGTGEDPRCAECQKDADCVALGYPAGSACTPVSQGTCAGVCPTGMACLPPCGYVPPDAE